MTPFFWIIFSTLLISLIAFVGAFAFYIKEKILNKILLFLVSFSAGVLMGGAFLHLIPEAIGEAGGDEETILNIFLYVIFGFCVFFALEQLIKWHHHHSIHHPGIKPRSDKNSNSSKIKPFSYLILISDGVHNFIDGLIIAGSFIAGPQVGFITAISVALHEIPQEIGDFGVLLCGGFKKKKALFLNFISATTIVLGGIVGFFVSGVLGEGALFLLPFAAGNFIYIAASDLVPEIKERDNSKKSAIYLLMFLLGIGLMFLIKIIFE